MSEKIVLADGELAKAAAVFDVPGGMAFTGRQFYIRESIRSINKIRAGDPVGTVRRGFGWCMSGDSASAIKTEKGWRVIHESGDCRSWIAADHLAHQWDDFISSWPVVYTPEES